MISRSNAAKKSGTRERFSGPFVTTGILLSFLLLLYVLFPEKEIIRRIEGASSVNSAVLRYQESLLRKDPENSGLRIKLAAGLVQSGKCKEALSVLNGFRKIPEAEDLRRRYLKVRYDTLKGLLVSPVCQGKRRDDLRRDFSRTAILIAESCPPPEEVRKMIADAGKIEATDAAAFLLKKCPLPDAPAASIAASHAPLQSSHYRDNARRYFAGMRDSKDITQKRLLFMKGVKSLQAGNLPEEALSAGAANIDGLCKDRHTLVFMAKTALAASKPHIAQTYMQKALGMEREKTMAGEK